MITAEINKSEPTFTNKRLSLDKLITITQALDANNYVVFTLFDEGGKACYQGVYYPSDLSLIDDIKRQVNENVTNGELSPTEANTFLEQLSYPGKVVGKRVAGGAEPSATISAEPGRIDRLFALSKSRRVRNWFFGVVICTIALRILLEAWALVPHKPDYNQLMQKGEYVQAVKEYPMKKQATEQYLFENKKLTQLETFNKRYPTANGQYDVAFYQKHWSKMLKIKGVTMTNVRKAELVVAYLKMHKPDDAYRLNLELNNVKLTQSIALEFIRNGEIDRAIAINQKLKNHDLTDMINAGKSYQQVIEKYQTESKDTSLSDEQRQTAADNLKVWQRNLKSIGE